jgi:hypothetical protein
MMEVLCQWCPEDSEDARVPLAIFMQHIQLMHSDKVEVIQGGHGGNDLDELKAAHMHLSEAQSQCDRSDYSTGREYKIVSEKLQFLLDDLMDLIYIAERFQR